MDSEQIRLLVRQALLCDGADVDESAYEQFLAAQRSVLEELLEHQLAQLYPPPFAIRRRFLRELLSTLDSGAVPEIDDDLYAACLTGIAAKTLASGEDQMFDGHRLLEMTPQGDYMVLRVATSIGGGLETGARLWSAGCAMLGLASAGALDKLVWGHVLELGSGTGLLGLGMARRGEPVTRATLTDGQVSVLANLRYNAEATQALAADSKSDQPLVPIDVQPLDWCNPSSFVARSPPNVIVGSDVAYDIADLPALASLLSQLLQPNGSAARAVLGITKRSDETYDGLHVALATAGLAVTEFEFSSAAREEAIRWLQFADDTVKEIALVHILVITAKV